MNTDQADLRNGSWAIVTGASRGIGRGFARELARRGHDIVLVSRTAKRLEALAAELRRDHGIKTRVVASDLSVVGAGSAVIDATADLDVGLLVSNAGAASMGGFLQVGIDELRADLHLNTLSHMELAHAFGTRLRTSGRRGGILLVSSTAALQSMALGANYSGAKAYVYNLGESLHREFSEFGVDVSVLLPGPTDTEGLHDRDDIAMGKLPMTAMSVETLVRQGLGALAKRKPSHIAGRMNRWMARLVPRRVLSWMLSKMLRRNAAPHLLPSAPVASDASVVNLKTSAA